MLLEKCGYRFSTFNFIQSLNLLNLYVDFITEEKLSKILVANMDVIGWGKGGKSGVLILTSYKFHLWCKIQVIINTL